MDNDLTYRDHVLVPTLVAMGFRTIYRARCASSAERLLHKHHRIAVVVTDAVLQNGEDGLAVCRLAKAAGARVVLLTSYRVPESTTLWLADHVAPKNHVPLLELAREVCGLADQADASA